MSLFDHTKMYFIAAKAKENGDSRASLIELRAYYISKLQSSNSIVKLAFDTRRIDQQNVYNPRRNLQYYHRSEPFIQKDSAEKIKTFFKLKTAVDSIKEDFMGDPDWLDSYCRVLNSALDRTLRVDQKDFDFFKPQMDYLEELLYLRYRLKHEDIIRLNEKELRNIILDKDERLLHKTIYAQYNNGGMNKTSAQPNQVMVKGSDPLIEKFFGDVKASAENREVERSVTITIKDKLPDQDIKKEG